MLNTSSMYREKQDRAILVHDLIYFGIDVLYQLHYLVKQYQQLVEPTTFDALVQQLYNHNINIDISELRCDVFAQINAIIQDEHLVTLMPRFTSSDMIQPIRDGEHMVLYLKALKNTLKQ